MPKDKGSSADPNQVTGPNLRWNDDMDYALLTSMIEEDNRGNRNDGVWSSDGYANMVQAVRSATGVTISKKHIKHRQKTFKERFGEAKPHAAKYRTAVKHYDMLKELYGADRATGRRSNTAKESQRRYERETIDLNDSVDDVSMHDPDFNVFQENQFSPGNVDSFSPAYGQSNQSTGTSSSRGMKRKANQADLLEAQFDKISSGINTLAEAVKHGNFVADKLHDVAERQVQASERQVTVAEKQIEIAEKQYQIIEKQVDIAAKHLTIIQQSRPRVYSESDVWDLLTELNIMDPLRMQCYQYLCVNEPKKRQLFGVPPQFRLQALFQIMTDAGIK
ncbi:Myb/SANT-like domain [Sesbania bispinosa]|nr:Myb/SANT-like domain [Sesbania bispinosa]